jgi:competence protein ComEC
MRALMRATPPVMRLALAFAAGAAMAHLPGPPLPASTLALAVLALIDIWLRPGARRLPVVIAFVAGGLAGATRPTDCPDPGHGAEVSVDGHFLAPTRGRGGAFQALPDARCRERTLTVLTHATVKAGTPVVVHGTWREGARTGVLIAASVEPSDAAVPRTVALVRWRGRLAERLDRLYGPRAPLVSALVLARKEGLDPGLREAFARSGTAHLLAISGFHVGVVAGMVLALLRFAGVPRRPAGLTAAAATWGYVGLIGFPDAACRAGLILGVVALSRARGRPTARWGPIATALLLLVGWDAGRVSSPGFQLSFAGAAGLVGGSRNLGDALVRATGGRLPRGAVDAVSAGVCATVATLPIVAWHFERVSLVGIPATLALSPMVALLLPGAMVSLLADALHPAAGAFLAGGVDLGLALLELTTRKLGGPDWASLWLARTWVPVFVIAAALGAVLARRWRGGCRTRVATAAMVGAAGVIVWPVALVLQGWGTVEIVAIDVGQGDGIAVRSPRGRWILVDAGPPVDGGVESQPVVTELRRRGVRRLEALVLTHPDLDHFGGAVAVLDRFVVGQVADPGYGAGKEGFIEVLEAATRAGVPWMAARAGQRTRLDGMTVEVLHPGADAGGDPEDANASSVVLLIRFGSFEALLTGDAPVEVERLLVPHLPAQLEVLKVGHHGSTTSTDDALLAATHPVVGLVSAGRGNRYGHPAPSVLQRLAAQGVEVHRTDREGTLRVVGRRDGTFQVRGGRPDGR